MRDIAVSRGTGAGLNVRDIGVHLVTTTPDTVLAGLMCDIGGGATFSENYTILYSISRGPRPRERELARRNTLAIPGHYLGLVSVSRRQRNNF